MRRQDRARERVLKHLKWPPWFGGIALCSLLERLYFRRRWIIQEAVVSERLYVTVGRLDLLVCVSQSSLYLLYQTPPFSGE